MTKQHSTGSKKKQTVKKILQEEPTPSITKNRLRLPYTAKTPGQADYLHSLRSNQITFCIGLAGTGKTALATQFGYLSLINRKYDKLIISRPIIGVGRTSGFLPGTMEQKLAPFLEPIYDEFENISDGQEEVRKLQNSRQIKVVPFEYLRGRNFHQSFILVDEAQNCKRNELLLLLNRFGMNSKMVIVGDPTQSDLPKHEQGAFSYYADIVEGLPGIGIVNLGEEDIVRSEMVKAIIQRIREREGTAPR